MKWMGLGILAVAMAVPITAICGITIKSSPVNVKVRSAVPLPGAQDFPTRCSSSGVLRCFGFDTAADFNTGSGGANGAYGANFGILPPSGTTDYTRAVRDTGLVASGASSLKFVIPSNSGSDTSGAFFTNFSSDLSRQFAGSAEFYVQWRQRFSPEFLGTKFAGSGGWKQVIIGAGDKPGCTLSTNSGGQCVSSCSALETVVQNTFQRGFAQMYNSCTGSASHGPYSPFEEPFSGFDFRMQNKRPAPYCLYSQQNTSYFSPIGNCLGYAANEWMTFQVGIVTGPRVGDEFVNSKVFLWIAREGRASEPAIEYTINLSAGSSAEDLRFGKVWLLPYQTGKSTAQTHATAQIWYDELIVSTQRIADPK